MEWCEHAHEWCLLRCSLCSYVVPLVFFHYRRHWTTLRDDCATGNNRGIISLAEGLPVMGGDASAGSGAASARSASGSAHLDNSSKLGLTPNRQGRESAMEATAAEDAGKAAAGLAPGAPVAVDIELGARSSPTPILEPAAPAGSSQPGSPVRSALSTLAGLPRRMAQAGSGRTGSGSAHRRTESQEPVLAQEDHSGSSMG